MSLKKHTWGLLLALAKLWEMIKCRIHLLRLGSKLPGATALPIIGNVYWTVKPTPEGIVHYTNKMREKFGCLFRTYVGPKLVITTTNRLDDELLLSRHDYLDKGLLYSFLKPWLGTGLLLSTGNKWRYRRKILTPAFHFKILEQFIPVFNNCGDEFVHQLRKTTKGGAFEVWSLTKLLTLDVICETTMGVQMNAQINNKTEYVTAVNEISGIIYEYAMKPWLYIDFIFKRTAQGRRYYQCLEILHRTTDKIWIWVDKRYLWDSKQGIIPALSVMFPRKPVT